MKRLFILFVVAVVAASCVKGDEVLPSDTTTYNLEITSNANVWIEGSGGEGFITYFIDNEQSGLMLNAESSVDWIAIVEVADIVFYVVDKNTDKVERRGNIELTYGTEVERVTIMQRTNFDDEYEATTTSGSVYYEGEDIHNYYVLLSIDGVDEEGYLFPNTKYFYFDLYSSIPAKNGVATIPDGVYTLTWSDDLGDGDMYYEYSCMTLTSDYDFEDIAYSEATLTVANGSIEAIVKLTTGERIRVVYSGSLNIPIYSSTVTNGLSTLTEDHIFDINDGVFVGAFVGDSLYNGCNTCQVYMFEYLDLETGEERGDEFQIDLQLPYGETSICGTYTEGTTEGRFIPGSAEDLGGQLMQQNSWYMTAGYVDFAPLVSGTVKVEKDAADLYIFTIDTVDDAGNVIKGVFRGRGEFVEW